MKSRKSLILDLLRMAPNRTMSIRQFIDHDPMIYHKISSRISDLKKLNHVVKYIPSLTNDWIDAHYRLEFDAERDGDGQLKFA